MDVHWPSLALTAGLFAVFCALASLFKHAEARHQRRRCSAPPATPEADAAPPARVTQDVDVALPATAGDAGARQAVLAGALQRAADGSQRAAGARRVAEWEETVPMVAASGVLPHELTRERIGTPPG